MAGRTFYIYCHTAPNGKRYIGQTCQEPEKRWNNGWGYVGQPYFKRAIDKYGWESFRHEILAVCHTKEMADLLETHLIAFFDTRNHSKGYNLTAGGGGWLGMTCSEETKRKISEANTGNTWDDERKKTWSEAMSGSGNPMYGRHHSKETCERMSRDRKGKSISPELREFRTNVLITVNKKKRIPIRQLDLDGNVIATYAGMAEAEEATGFNHSGIWSVCRGKHDKAYGYRWEYVDDKLREQAEAVRRNRSTTCMAVIQYSLDGTELARFKSLSAAERETGVHRDGISDCIHSGSETYGGYVWRFDGEQQGDADKTAVVQLDKHGKRIAEYGSLIEASSHTGIPRYQIRNCCRGRKKSAGGFVWEFMDEAMRMNAPKAHIAVVQLDVDGNEVARFTSIKAAMNATGHDRHRISECCQGRRESYRNYRWRYAEQAEINEPASGLFS